VVVPKKPGVAIDMLIKLADDKFKRLALLQDLQQSPMTPRTQFSNRAPWLKS